MARRIAVEIVGDASSLERSYKKAARQTKGFEKNVEQTGRRSRSVFGGLGRTIGLVAGGAGLAGLAGAAHAAFSEMQTAQQVSAQTDAALRSTGQAANVTKKNVDDLADSMLRKSGIDDEATKTAENMLLTFTKVRNETGKGNRIFDQATRAVADMATRMNGGAIPSAEQMQKASLQLGKALNDPIKGVGALARVGVQFTKAQKTQIKAMVDSGNVMGAQKVILAELRKEFGGSAAAAGSTFTGKITILKESLRNLGAEIATKLLPTITKIVDSMTKWLSKNENQKKILDAVNTAVTAVTAVLKILKTVFDGLSFAVGGARNALILLAGAFVALKLAQMVSSVRQLAGSFGLLTTKTTGATGATRGLTSSFLGKAGLVAGAGLAAFEITTLVLKLTGLDKKLNQVGASAFDFAAKLGLVHDPTAQFAGKTNLGQAGSAFVRARAARLERGGLTPEQAAARIAATHPGLAQHDIQVLAGVGAGGVTVNGGLHLHGVQNTKQMEEELHKRAKARPQPRRGAR